MPTSWVETRIGTLWPLLAGSQDHTDATREEDDETGEPMLITEARLVVSAAGEDIGTHTNADAVTSVPTWGGCDDVLGNNQASAGGQAGGTDQPVPVEDPIVRGSGVVGPDHRTARMSRGERTPAEVEQQVQADHAKQMARDRACQPDAARPTAGSNREHCPCERRCLRRKVRFGARGGSSSVA